MIKIPHHLLLTLALLLSSLLSATETDEHIKIDQFGYLPEAKKIAIISNPKLGFNGGESFAPAAIYQLKNAFTDETVFSASITSWNNGATHSQSGDQIWWFDFSEYQTQGTYYIYDSNSDVRSYTFAIGANVYNDVLKQACRTFYYQRCNSSKTLPYAEEGWTDEISFTGTEQDTDCRLVTEPSADNSKDLSGGWFDAGDYNKYINYADGVIHDLLDAYQINPLIWGDNFNIPESGNGIPDLLDEIKWELDWFLKGAVAICPPLFMLFQ